MDGRKVRVLRRIEGDKLVTEQRDRSSGNIHVLSEMYVDSDGQMIEVVGFIFNIIFTNYYLTAT